MSTRCYYSNHELTQCQWEGDNWTSESLRPIFDVAMKAGNINLTIDEIADLEKTTDSLELNLIRMWKKEMK